MIIRSKIIMRIACVIQWNLSIVTTYGPFNSGLYKEVVSLIVIIWDMSIYILSAITANALAPKLS